MILIGKDSDLIKKLSDKNSLLDSSLTQINIINQPASGLFIELYFSLVYSKVYKNMKLVFSYIQEYSFNYNSEHNFYDVTSYKFFIVEDKYIYLSLDPVDETDKPSLEDQDFILSKEVTAYAID